MSVYLQDSSIPTSVHMECVVGLAIYMECILEKEFRLEFVANAFHGAMFYYLKRDEGESEKNETLIIKTKSPWQLGQFSRKRDRQIHDQTEMLNDDDLEGIHKEV